MATPTERFWRHVDKGGEGGCWLWTGTLTRPAPMGYGRFWPSARPVLAHRFVYELLVGPIPEGLQIDHLCRVRRCVNPEHLEVVTQSVNLKRGFASRFVDGRCAAGHVVPEGATRCTQCNAKYKRAWEAERRLDPAWRERRRASDRERYAAAMADPDGRARLAAKARAQARRRKESMLPQP